MSIQPSRILSTAALLLACSTPAFATGSMQCEGKPYSAEIQFRLSSGEPTQLIVARADDDEAQPERFELQHRAVDYKRRVMSLKGTSLGGSGRTTMLNVSKTRGTLTFSGARHRLRCDWESAG